MNILITGSRGQLGYELKQLTASGQYPNYHCLYTHSDELSLTNPDALQSFFKEHAIDCVINCAAYTAVDKAESELDQAHRINVTAVQNLVTCCNLYNALLIHVSTDFVFDGTNHIPYIETDVPNPLSVYGKTKLAGELEAAKSRKHFILRTSWLYSSHGNNFVKTIQRLAKERGSLNIIFDQIGTPTYALDLAQVIVDIIPQYKDQLSGVYHFSDEGCASWFDFAYEIVHLSNISCTLNPIETTAYPTPAVRPKYSVLNKKKIKETFGIVIPYWKDSLKKCIDLIQIPS